MKQIEEFETYAQRRLEQFSGPERLLAAIKYSFFAGGKRIRPRLMFGVAVMQPQRAYQELFPLALALEMVHTYSLIHDDLPALDNDDLRRGKLTNHLAFDEATALLAGDALLSQSFEVFVETDVQHQTLLIELLKYFTAVIGERGMIAGQMQDMLLEAMEDKTPTLTELQHIHYLKTGKLLEFALLAPVILYQYPRETEIILRSFAYDIGLLFQAMDDLLDGVDESLTGKTQGSDQKNNKITYLTFMTHTALAEYIATLENKCLQSLKTLADEGYDITILQAILDMILRKTALRE